MKEGCGYRPTFDVLGVAFDRTTPETGDFPQSAFKSDRRNPPASIVSVDEKAGDPPIGKAGETVEIISLILDARKLLGRPELTPADSDRAVVHQGGVSLVVPNSTFLLRSKLRDGPVPESVLQVKRHAPTAAPYAVVPLDQPGKIRPRTIVQSLNVEAAQNALLLTILTTRYPREVVKPSPIPEVGVAIGISEPGAHSGSSERDRDTMQTELGEKGLPEGTASAPVAGYLYFPLIKKKNTPLQLECALKGNKVVLTLP